jgi:hypothetical protein
VVAWWCGKEKGEKREARKIAVLRKLGPLLIVAYCISRSSLVYMNFRYYYTLATYSASTISIQCRFAFQRKAGFVEICDKSYRGIGQLSEVNNSHPLLRMLFP